MKFSIHFWLPAIVAVLLVLPVQAEEPAQSGNLLKRAANVDEPLPETYEPLNSTYVGDGEQLDNTIEQSWELRKEAGKRKTSTVTSGHDGPEREALEKRIQEPGLNPATEGEPEITDTGHSLRIRDE